MYPTESHNPDAMLTNPCPILIMLNFWLGSNKYQPLSHWFDTSSVQRHGFGSHNLLKEKTDARLIWWSHLVKLKGKYKNFKRTVHVISRNTVTDAVHFTTGATHSLYSNRIRTVTNIPQIKFSFYRLSIFNCKMAGRPALCHWHVHSHEIQWVVLHITQQEPLS